jgi:Na+/H+-dicarboxylate symporter
LVLGGVLGVFFPSASDNVKIVGQLFIRLLKMIIIPLILASMVSGLVSIGSSRSLGRIGFRTFLYYLTTTVIAIVVGLILVNLIRPGVGLELPEDMTQGQVQREETSATDILFDIVPENPLKAMAQGKTLSVIFFALLLGAVLVSVGDAAKPMVSFFNSLNVIMLRMTDWIMRLAPIGVFALMWFMIGKLGRDAIGYLAMYMITVLAGLLIHAVITLPLLLWLFGRYSPLRFIRHMFSAVATAFSTASSAATLPITMDCLEKNAGVSNKVASFVLPIGATVNMDGTALYEAVAAMFIAQFYGIDLGFGQQVIIVVTATLASIGAAAIPNAGLVTMVIVLDAVGLPLEGTLIIAGVDRILDMCRTAVNVWGDACGAAIVARMEGETLDCGAIREK